MLCYACPAGVAEGRQNGSTVVWAKHFVRGSLFATVQFVAKNIHVVKGQLVNETAEVEVGGGARIFGQTADALDYLIVDDRETQLISRDLPK